MLVDEALLKYKIKLFNLIQPKFTKLNVLNNPGIISRTSSRSIPDNRHWSLHLPKPDYSDTIR
ncbi:hypothetical protein KGMB02408_09790 [Bacteroides faecalis]|uniref:Uncharacterized protein n=1 Tax=Bacteroides faecalis TaxID=2447885 RepID=A0A401LRB8_9BACE|nr:hypothetical protein KGMB02408_09790 [Bacteroides faecalis]